MKYRERWSEPPAGTRATVMIFRGVKWLVMSYPMSASDPPAALSPAERSVALYAVLGLSNAEIARIRGKSARTIAAQLAAVYRKLDVKSRFELAFRFGRLPPGIPQNTNH